MDKTVFNFNAFPKNKIGKAFFINLVFLKNHKPKPIKFSLVLFFIAV